MGEGGGGVTTEAPVWRVCIHWRIPQEPAEQRFTVEVQSWDADEARCQARAEWAAQTPEPRLWLYSTCDRLGEQLVFDL